MGRITETEKQPCFIIAEAGVNHNGDIELAKKLVDAAKDSGADAVKFQTWITELLVTRDSDSAAYQVENTGTHRQFDLLKSLELSHQSFSVLKDYAESVGIKFLSTPDEEESAKFLVANGLDLIKVGSAELTNLPYLDFLASYDLPMILSTGMSTLDEVREAVKVIRAQNSSKLTVLHCVSNYPAEYSECNLRAMKTMEEELNCEIGYSDHTIGNDICLAAVAMGAKVIEKHITLDKNMEGPDHICSSEPAEFKSLVDGIRRIESAMGNGLKVPTKNELATRKVVRKEIVAVDSLEKGCVIEMKHLALKRGNGLGVGSECFMSMIGKTLAVPLTKDQVVLLDHLV